MLRVRGPKTNTLNAPTFFLFHIFFFLTLIWENISFTTFNVLKPNKYETEKFRELYYEKKIMYMKILINFIVQTFITHSVNIYGYGF